MLARHRQSLILQSVRNDGSARVSDLTQQLGVSDMTIRRDLEVLAKDGLVEKVHGGAVLPGSHAGQEPGFEDKLVLERPEKSTIARAAAALVRPNTAVAIAAGTTTFPPAQGSPSSPTRCGSRACTARPAGRRAATWCSPAACGPRRTHSSGRWRT